MKHIFLFTVATLIYAFAYAQDWRVIPQNGSTFQPAASDWYYPIWIDSAIVSGSNSIFYFARTIGYSPGLGTNEYNIKAACWAGYYARMNADSVTFYNHAGLQIVFKQNTAVHSSWTFCKTDTGMYFIATVDSIVSGVVLGQPDSIKFIRIQAFDSLNNPVANSNNITISLSKKNGLLKTFAFYSFLPVNEMIVNNGEYYDFYNVSEATLELTGNGTEGVTDFGWMDAFNYAENSTLCIYDEHKNFPASGPVTMDKTGFTLSEVLSKTVFGSLDSIAYTIHQCKTETDHLTDSVFRQEENFNIVIRPDSSLSNFKLIETKAGCTVFTNSSNYTAGIPLLYKSNGVQTSKLLPLQCGLLTYDLSHDSIYSLPICDGDFPQNSYCRNWGGGYYDTYYYSNVSKHVLSYISTGSFSWGTPKTCSEIMALDESEMNIVRIFPSPAQNEIHCVLPENEKFDIVVFDVSGKVVLHPNSSNAVVSLSGVEDLTTSISGISINVKQLPPGIYFIEARGEKILRGKFVKE